MTITADLVGARSTPLRLARPKASGSDTPDPSITKLRLAGPTVLGSGVPDPSSRGSVSPDPRRRGSDSSGPTRQGSASSADRETRARISWTPHRSCHKCAAALARSKAPEPLDVTRHKYPGETLQPRPHRLQWPQLPLIRHRALIACAARHRRERCPFSCPAYAAQGCDVRVPRAVSRTTGVSHLPQRVQLPRSNTIIMLGGNGRPEERRQDPTIAACRCFRPATRLGGTLGGLLCGKDCRESRNQW